MLSRRIDAYGKPPRLGEAAEVGDEWELVDGEAIVEEFDDVGSEPVVGGTTYMTCGLAS